MTRLAIGPLTMSGPAGDADGLPFWQGDDTNGWQHRDVEQVAFAMAAGFRDFDLIAYDRWLHALDACDAKRELLDRRARALRAMQENNTDALLRHLEWMQRRRFEIQRDDFLLPLARRDAAWHARTRKPRRAELHNKIDAWISKQLARDPEAKSPEMWARAPAPITDDIGPERFRKRVTDVRKKLLGQ